MVTWTDTPVLPFEASESALAARARAFHTQNPHVMQKLVEIARDLRARGVRQVGIALLFERLRWLSTVRTEGDPYRLNNSFRAFYARQLMADHPELAGMFTTRESTTDPDYFERQAR
jgi:hypothetical protein